MIEPLTVYKRHRFPARLIAYAVWLYFRFPLSLRLIEELLLERGIVVSYESVWAVRRCPPFSATPLLPEPAAAASRLALLVDGSCATGADAECPRHHPEFASTRGEPSPLACFAQHKGGYVSRIDGENASVATRFKDKDDGVTLKASDSLDADLIAAGFGIWQFTRSRPGQPCAVPDRAAQTCLRGQRHRGTARHRNRPAKWEAAPARAFWRST